MSDILVIPPTAAYKVMAHRLDLTEHGTDEAIDLPAGWEPFAVGRQGDELVLLLKQTAGG